MLLCNEPKDINKAVVVSGTTLINYLGFVYGIKPNAAWITSEAEEEDDGCF
jgi:hypothetical protein